MTQTQCLFQSRSPSTAKIPTPRHILLLPTHTGYPRAEAAIPARSLCSGPRHRRATRRRQSGFLRDSPQARPLRARSLTSSGGTRLSLGLPDQALPWVAEQRHRHSACAAAAPPQLPGRGSAPGPGAERGGMASLVPAAASSPAGAASRSKKRPASPGTGGGAAKKKKATAPGGSQVMVRGTASAHAR